MWRSRESRFDVACAISKGARDYQEDAIVSDFPIGSDTGFIVLADGMGGHAAGDVSSKLVLTEVYGELKFQLADPDAFEAEAPAILREIANIANDSISSHVAHHPEAEGMGATLVVPVIMENRLYWLSVGDSPLYLFRQGKMKQLNEDHSMAPQIDLMVKSGLLEEDAALDHPDRNCLTSVMMGERIPKVDCPEQPIELSEGDIIVCSSDGLQFLADAQIEKVLNKNRRKSASEIAEILLNELGKLDDPDQDNIAFSVIKVNDATATPASERARRQTMAKAANVGTGSHVYEPEQIRAVNTGK
ncbi:PP2C family protein-serine/threonine phosphatase [Profundibacter sp.]